MKYFLFESMAGARSLTILLCLFSGCSKNTDGRPAVELAGTVKLDGAILSEGRIQFRSSKTGESAYTNLDAEGHYTLKFPSADIGTEYEITLGPPVNDLEERDALAVSPPSNINVIPRRYSKHTTSGLKRKIEQAGKNEFNFELKSK